MFGWKKSASRDALLAAAKALAEGQKRLAAAEARVERLKGLIAAEAPAQAALQAAVAGDAGAGLARFAAGKKTACADLVTAAETASRAATVAREALPAAEAAVHEAGAAALQLDDQRRLAAAKVLVAHADAFGQAYATTFRKLCGQHDELRGIGLALAALGPNITLVHDPLEAPRFDLPSLPPGEVFSAFLRHVPQVRTITSAQGAWSRAARALADDPLTDVARVLRQPAPAEPEAPVGELRRHHRAETAQAIPEGYTEVRTGPGITSIVPAEPPRRRPPMRVYGGDAA